MFPDISYAGTRGQNASTLMNMKKLNNILIYLEIVSIVLPSLFILIAVGIPIAGDRFLLDVDVPATIIAVVTIVSCAAATSVLLLCIKILRSVAILNKEHILYWGFILSGIFIVAVSYASHYLPDSMPLLRDWLFFDELKTFILGGVLIIPVLHVFISARVNERC